MILPGSRLAGLLLGCPSKGAAGPREPGGTVRAPPPCPCVDDHGKMSEGQDGVASGWLSVVLWQPGLALPKVWAVERIRVPSAHESQRELVQVSEAATDPCHGSGQLPGEVRPTLSISPPPRGV